MYSKTQAIVLHHIKYSETSIIVHLYTEAFGRRSYIVQGIRSRKSKWKMGMFQPLSLLDLEVDHKPTRDLQRIKDLRIIHPSVEIREDIYKGAISMFIAEIIYRTIREEESNKSLFEFLTNSIQFLNLNSEGSEDFHLWFLIQLSRFLGCYPSDNYSSERNCFDLLRGDFQPSIITNAFQLEPELSFLIHKIIHISPPDLGKLNLSGNIRSLLLDKLIDYYQMHLESLGEIRSLKVLQEVFSAGQKQSIPRPEDD